MENNLMNITENAFINDIKKIVEQGRNAAYGAVNTIMIETYWHIGRRIVEQEQNGNERAEYGKQLIEMLSVELTRTYGKGFGSRNLWLYKQFYLTFNDINILHTRVQNLTWSHIRTTLRVDDPVAARWYLQTASQEMWSVRTLDRNISTQYFERHFKQPQILDNPENKTAPDKLEILKNPVMAEFLGFQQNTDFSETELEKGLISHLQEFMVELGRGFAFVARQQHIFTDAGDFYIDLVFYNYILKCFVLIDLKKGRITHQDVGQMDMYVRMYDDLKRTEGDNPTVGIVLCSETSKDIARYSVLHDSEQLFAAKYLPLMPTEEELRREIEQQKEMYMLQMNDKNDDN
jgi:predicted nuclease of restriction endonuclease-like (RecB) superfamily